MIRNTPKQTTRNTFWNHNIIIDTAIKAPVTQVVALVVIPAAAPVEDILVVGEWLRGQDHLDLTLCLQLEQHQTRAIDDLSFENDENYYVNFSSSKKQASTFEGHHMY